MALFRPSTLFGEARLDQHAISLPKLLPSIRQIPIQPIKQLRGVAFCVLQEKIPGFSLILGVA